MSLSPSSLPPDGRRVVAIIGGGVSGCLVAANLLRHARAPLAVILCERGAQVGGGVAYGAAGEGHVLNVPVARMGAWTEVVDDFFAWLRQLPGFGGLEPTAFVARRMFELYVRDVLRTAERGAASGVSLATRQFEAVDIEELADGRAKIVGRDESSFLADQVVLALGHLPGEYPLREALWFYHGPRYAHVPWAADALNGFSADDDLLLVGQGLTAVDLITTLAGRNHRGVNHALSRRGLRPLAHRLAPPYPPYLDLADLPRTVLALVRRVRREVRRAAAAGIDWRPVLDALRPITPALWQALPLDERARFLRHVRPHWETHRHRLAPKVHARFEELLQSGRVRLHAGRVQELREERDHAIAVIRPRGTTERLTLRVAKVINCTGPCSDYTKYQHPLLISLLARGLIDHDSLALGVAADVVGNVLRYRTSQPVGWLHTLGSPMKGVLWECTAVPEIRVQAAELARRLLLAHEPHRTPSPTRA